jgi:hypothetical protein
MGIDDVTVAVQVRFVGKDHGLWKNCFEKCKGRPGRA